MKNMLIQPITEAIYVIVSLDKIRSIRSKTVYCISNGGFAYFKRGTAVIVYTGVLI